MRYQMGKGRNAIFDEKSERKVNDKLTRDYHMKKYSRLCTTKQ